MLKKTERDEDDFVDIRPRDADRAANADCGVYVISDVSQSGESHLHETAQVQVKGQGPVLGEKLPVPSSDETNECTPDKNTSEDTQYDTLVQQRPDEREEYMRLHVMSAAARPQVEGQPRNVDSAADVAQSRGSGSLHTSQVHVKGQENIIRAGIPGPSRDESNKCSPYENEDAQYETLAQQTRDEGHEYMTLPVRSAAPRPSRPQVAVKTKSLPPL
ncbi:hypothetical protein C0Q70_05532 [Pomacea canaliculata]|uniref:Uncharacterized protein n=1 Tax=Pomacea canaliculata TaxID=400727 RepID=A0A2T7PLF6_POMCA|nr:hypothetical protein C0Q70_05532 [Pomacea canaliculata]